MKQKAILQERDFTLSLCQEDYFSQFYSHLAPITVFLMKQMIKLWLKLVIRIDSIERTIQILKETETLDKVLLRR